MVRHRYLSRLTKEHGLSLTISLVVITLSFFLHLKWCGSTIHLNEAVFQRYLDNHLTIYPFNIRPFTSQGILILGKILSLSVKTSFFIMQFSLTFILGLCFYRYLRLLKISKNLSGLGLFLMLASLPILAAHIEPMHTWDDIWAYLFVTLSLLFILKSKIIVSLIWFTLACFAREQSLFFWPILLLAIWLFNKNGNFLKKLVLTTVPILIYGIYYLACWQPLDPDRLSLIFFNFENHLRTSDTIYSLFISFGFVWLLGTVAVFRSPKTKEQKFLNLSTIFTVPVTLLFVLFFTNARETRILFPPFVFLIPLALYELDTLFKWYKHHYSPRFVFISIITVGILMTAGILLGKILFPEFEYRQCPNFHRLWAGIHFGIILNIILYYIIGRTLKKKVS